MLTKKIFLLLFILIIPCLSIADQNPEFMKGYVTSKIEDRFPNEEIQIDVVDQTIIVYGWPQDLESEAIQTYLTTVSPGYTVECDASYKPMNLTNNASFENEIVFDEGHLLPELNPFFPTMLAQSHILGYSAGYRVNDRVFGSVIPVSIGDQFSLYQFKIDRCARLYFGIEACVWAIFEARTNELSLINADYFIAFPLTYINNRFSARLRLYHESSHLGDEFLLENENIVRVNPSMEAIDLAFAYETMCRCTLFAGYSYVLRSDKSFKVKPSSVYYGFNYMVDFLKIDIFNVEAIPYVAAYFTNEENNHWGLDSSVAIGYQWNKSYGRKLRVYLEGHRGYSAEGQFSHEKTQYIALKILYGY